MRTVLSVQHIEFFVDKNGVKQSRTYALVVDKLGNQEEAVGFGKDFKENDKVSFFHDQRYNQNKMEKIK